MVTAETTLGTAPDKAQLSPTAVEKTANGAEKKGQDEVNEERDKAAGRQKAPAAAPSEAQSKAKSNNKQSEQNGVLPETVVVGDAAQLNQDTLQKKAEELHEAIHRKSWGVTGHGHDPDSDAILRTLNGLSEADRASLEKIYHQDFDAKGKDDTLRSEIRSAFKDREADRSRIETELNAKDGCTNDAGYLVSALCDAKTDKTRGSAEVRAILENLNSEQLKQLDDGFKKAQGQGYIDALKNSKDLDQTTRESLEILTRGVDNRTSKDLVKLAQIALDNSDQRAFCEAIRGDSQQAVDARKQIMSDETLKSQIADKFRSDYTMNTEEISALPYQKRVDNVVMNYLQEGRVSLATIAEANTGSWIFDNKENIELAARISSDKEQAQFVQGKELAENNNKPANQQEQESLDYYNKIHASFKAHGSEREASIWEDQLIHGRETIVSEMAKTHSDGWDPFHLTGGHNKNDLFGKVEGLSKEDWDTLKNDPVKGQALRKEINDSLSKYADADERKRINELIDKKLESRTYEESRLPAATATDDLLKAKGSGSKPEEILKLCEKALQDPNLRERLNKPDEQLTEEERQIKGVIKDSVRDLVEEKIPPARVRDVSRDISKYLLTDGSIPPHLQLEMGVSKQDVLEQLVTASQSEREQAYPLLRSQEKAIVEAARQNSDGKLDLADRMRSFIIGSGGKYSDFKDALSKLDPAEVKALKDKYTNKYHGDIDNDYLAKVDSAERTNYAGYLATTSSDGRAKYYQDYASMLKSESGISPDGSKLTLERAGDLYANSMQEYQRIYKTLPKEKQEALDKFFGTALKEYKDSKQKLAEIAVDAAITAGAVAAAPITAGASMELVLSTAATAGAAFRVGMMSSIEGNDFDWSAKNVTKEIVKGGTEAALNFVGSKLLAGTKNAAEAMTEQATRGFLQTAKQLGKEAMQNALTGGGSSVASELITSPFNPNGLDPQQLLQSALVGAAAGGLTTVVFRGVAAGLSRLSGNHFGNGDIPVNLKKGSNGEVIIDPKDQAGTLQVKHANGDVTTVDSNTAPLTLQKGDQIISGPQNVEVVKGDDGRHYLEYNGRRVVLELGGQRGQFHDQHPRLLRGENPYEIYQVGEHRVRLVPCGYWRNSVGTYTQDSFNDLGPVKVHVVAENADALRKLQQVLIPALDKDPVLAAETFGWKTADPRVGLAGGTRQFDPQRSKGFTIYARTPADALDIQKRIDKLVADNGLSLEKPVETGNADCIRGESNRVGIVRDVYAQSVDSQKWAPVINLDKNLAAHIEKEFGNGGQLTDAQLRSVEEQNRLENGILRYDSEGKLSMKVSADDGDNHDYTKDGVYVTESDANSGYHANNRPALYRLYDRYHLDPVDELLGHGSRSIENPGLQRQTAETIQPTLNGQMYITGKVTFIGCGQDADIKIGDPRGSDEYGISPQHAAIYTDAQGNTYITDLGSTHGTYINGRRLEPTTDNKNVRWERVGPNDRVTLGKDSASAGTKAYDLYLGRTSGLSTAETLPSSRALKQSNDFATQHQTDGRLEDGFQNAGQGNRINSDGSFDKSFGVATVVDRANDPVLQRTIETAKQRFGRINPPAERARQLARYVHDLMTPANMTGSQLDGWYAGFSSDHAGQRALLGEFINQGRGGCTQQSMLYKVLADELFKDVPGARVSLVRGATREDGVIDHSWVNVDLGRGSQVIDPRENILGRPNSELPNYRGGGPIPLGSQVRWGRPGEDYSDGWTVQSFDPRTGDAIVTHNGQKTLAVNELMHDPNNINKLLASGGMPRVGDTYQIRRNNGDVEEWTVVSYDRKTGEVIFGKENAITDRIDPQDFTTLRGGR
jgi:hypothetical protein